MYKSSSSIMKKEINSGLNAYQVLEITKILFKPTGSRFFVSGFFSTEESDWDFYQEKTDFIINQLENLGFSCRYKTTDEFSSTMRSSPLLNSFVAPHASTGYSTPTSTPITTSSSALSQTLPDYYDSNTKECWFYHQEYFDEETKTQKHLKIDIQLVKDLNKRDIINNLVNDCYEKVKLNNLKYLKCVDLFFQQMFWESIYRIINKTLESGDSVSKDVFDLTSNTYINKGEKDEISSLDFVYKSFNIDVDTEIKKEIKNKEEKEEIKEEKETGNKSIKSQAIKNKNGLISDSELDFSVLGEGELDFSVLGERELNFAVFGEGFTDTDLKKLIYNLYKAYTFQV